jgi:hypothetical protein
MDDTGGVYQQLLADLRKRFAQKLRGPMTDTADKRLQRTLRHYIQEIFRVQGTLTEQDVLRETFDSMASWYRRNTVHLSPATSTPIAGDIDMDASVAAALSSFGSTPLDQLTDSEADPDPLALFERLKATRAPTAGQQSTPAPIPIRVPELESVETRARTASAQPKDFLQKQEDIVKYREVEYNLIVNSKDRDWLHSMDQNRYNFSVVLDSASRPQGKGAQATIQNRFRNIVRLEFVKALLPVEGLDVVVTRDCEAAEPSAVSDTAFYSALAFPSVNVMLDEIQGNNYGTNDIIDKSLAVCQYDATWRSDALNTGRSTNRGYTLFFPKFMKAQRVYQPTPLANLQKLSFQVLTPENQLLSKLPDSLAIQSILFSRDISGSCYSDASGEYLFLRTKKWFPLWSFSQLDRVLFDGLTFTSTTSAITQGGSALIRWLQRVDGHAVVGVAHILDDTGLPIAVQDGANDCGYANLIVVRNRFKDPTASGDCGLDLFTGAVLTEEVLAQEFRDYPAAYQDGGVLNLSRQVQLVLRIITREMDSTTNVRPDNV